MHISKTFVVDFCLQCSNPANWFMALVFKSCLQSRSYWFGGKADDSLLVSRCKLNIDFHNYLGIYLEAKQI